MDQFTKEGRKLRPRKTIQRQVTAEKVEYQPRSSQDRNEPYQHRQEGRPYSEHRPQRGDYRSRDSYGAPRQLNERRGDYGTARQGSDNRDGNYGHRTYGERNYGQRPEGERNYGQHRSAGERRGNYGAGRPSSERRTYGEGRPGQTGAPKFKSRPAAGAKKAFGMRHPSKPANAKFNKQSNEGINRMIERRPVVNDSISDQKFESVAKDVVRLNKFIANSGVCSRREADTLIQAGVVTVNGQVVTELGTKVNIFNDDIRFNGERLKGEEKVYIIMNKPKGYVTTASDPHAEKTVVDLLKGCQARVYPVGRLDKNTTGVLLLTNDGEIAERLTHPSYDKKKIYQVALDRELSAEDYDTILAGVTLSDGPVKADELEYIDESDKRKLGIEIHSGKNRIVRRIFESLGYTVKALDRVYFAGLTKKGLKKGEWRYLTEAEVNILKIGAYV